ncbi:hypothetical protein LEP1GSC062_3771 [Leptospira alexanderi serovar Manhao 3 str. L 60]|uniref:Uncharacterized protein n=1 Tax=Leptospira alexanderi serovar Manhao 3 str. L 60 TaxID=1049759 RepID=V6HYQ1_9LEPT|nr:hypothetical protein LEP1GSC062_3771 [Leptospira alexanderi serovar Manhao 3 str. L 60]
MFDLEKRKIFESKKTFLDISLVEFTLKRSSSNFRSYSQSKYNSDSENLIMKFRSAFKKLYSSF